MKKRKRISMKHLFPRRSQLDALIILNDGQAITETNFWDGYDIGQFQLSYNAGALRLLVPESCTDRIIEETKNVREVIVSRGPWPEMGLAVALEILFEDDSNAPLSLQMDTNAVDIMPSPKDHGKEIVFSLWIKGAIKHKEFPGKVRIVPTLPYLKKWGE
jgi:hypothetical protein